MDLLHFTRLLRRSWRLLVASLCLGALLGVGAAKLRPTASTHAKPVTYFTATETLGYDPSAGGQTVTDGASDLATIASFATSQAVTDGVGEELGTDGASAAEHITTVTRPTTNSIDVTAYADSAASARELASTFASVTVTAYAQKVATQAADRATQLTKRLEDLKARRADVAQQLLNPGLSVVDRDTLEAQSDALVNQYRVAYDQYINLPSAEIAAPPLYPLAKPRPSTIDAATYQAALERGRTGQNHLDAATAAEVAEPSTSGSSIPKGPVTLGLLGAFLGLAFGVGIVMLRARLDSKLRSRLDFEEAFDLPVLGGVPELPPAATDEGRVVVTALPYSPAAEAFRAARAGLLLLGSDEPDRQGALVVMVTSALPKEGKSTNCANLAAAFGEAGLRVLALNCDYRRPTLHRYFGVEDLPGVVQTTPVPNVRIMTNVAKRWDSPGVVAAAQRDLVAQARPHFDVIVLDTAPLLSTSDPIDVVSAADFVVLVGRPGQTDREDARQVTAILDRHRADVAGVLLTAVDGTDKALSAYYYSYAIDGDARRGKTAAPKRGATKSAKKRAKQDAKQAKKDAKRRGKRGKAAEWTAPAAQLDPVAFDAPVRPAVPTPTAAPAGRDQGRRRARRNRRRGETVAPATAPAAAPAQVPAGVGGRVDHD